MSALPTEGSSIIIENAATTSSNEGNTRVPNSVKFSDDRNTSHEFSEMNDNDISPSDSEINIIESLEFYKISLIIAYII